MVATVLGKGVYSLAEAARYTGVNRRRVGAWFNGWPGGAGLVVHGDYAQRGRMVDRLSFLDLVEVLVVGKLRAKGSLQAIRRAHHNMARAFDTLHPFSHRQLLTNEGGTRFFIEAADELGDTDLIELLATPQHAIQKVLRPYLSEIDYAPDTDLAERWHIASDVVIDPAIRYGKPVVCGSGLPTSILAAAYEANGRDTERVADWYNIAPQDVEAAVSFESRMSGHGSSRGPGLSGAAA